MAYRVLVWGLGAMGSGVQEMFLRRRASGLLNCR